MATFTWTAKGTQGATYDGTFPNHYKKAQDNYYAGNLTVLSESLLANGKISYYVSGNYNLDLDYKNVRYNEQTGAISYSGYTFELKQYGNQIGTGEADGYFVENIYDLSTIGYINKDRTYYSETRVEEVITGTFDYEKMGETLSSQRIYYISGDDTFNGSRKDDKLSSGPGKDIIYGNGGNDTLNGESGSDIIYGGDGSDKLYGESGNDSLIPGTGDDYLDGGVGDDGVWLSGNFSDYSITGTTNHLTIIDNRKGNNEGRNTLKNIELLNFNDKKNLLITQAIINTNTNIDAITGVSSSGTYNDGIINYENDHSSHITRLYNAAFGRVPDSGGLAHWVNELNSGRKDKNTIANAFLDSSEFKIRYGDNISNGVYVENLYKNVLGRMPDHIGYDQWLSSLNNNSISKADALLGFTDSAEHIALFS